MVILIKNSIIDFTLGSAIGLLAYRLLGYFNLFDIFIMRLFIALVFAKLYLVIKFKIVEQWQASHKLLL